MDLLRTNSEERRREPAWLGWATSRVKSEWGRRGKQRGSLLHAKTSATGDVRLLPVHPLPAADSLHRAAALIASGGSLAEPEVHGGLAPGSAGMHVCGRIWERPQSREIVWSCRGPFCRWTAGGGAIGSWRVRRHARSIRSALIAG